MSHANLPGHAPPPAPGPGQPPGVPPAVGIFAHGPHPAGDAAPVGMTDVVVAERGSLADGEFELPKDFRDAAEAELLRPPPVHGGPPSVAMGIPADVEPLRAPGTAEFEPAVGASIRDGALPPGYELLGPLGRGGMGIVFKARQVSTGRVVAIKMLLVTGGSGEITDRNALRGEAATLSKLQHPNIVAVHDVGDHDNRPYLAMECLAGGSLETRLDNRQITLRQGAEIIAKLARAVHVCHRNGIIHRDLKPGNILLTETGEPKITDFGLAKFVENANSQTRSGMVKGTPNYMSPEQASGNSKHAGPQTDVYGLGAMLYEVMTAKPPFDGDNPVQTIINVATKDPVMPRELDATLPEDLELVCMKCLEKEPARRYATAEDLADDLQRWLDGKPVHARPVSSAEHAGDWLRRNSNAVMIIGGTLLLAIIAVVVTLLMIGKK